MQRKQRILFAKLGRFSYINDAVINQLVRNFPNHDLVVADVKDLAKQSYFSSFYNLLAEFALFGPSVFRSRGDLHAFFFRTPFMFRRLNQLLVEKYGALAPELDFVLQTQGLFNARLPGPPLMIYTDYTFLNNLDDAEYDRRHLRSEKYLRYEAELYRRAEAIAASGSHVERVLIRQYGCDPAR